MEKIILVTVIFWPVLLIWAVRAIKEIPGALRDFFAAMRRLMFPIKTQ